MTDQTIEIKAGMTSIFSAKNTAELNEILLTSTNWDDSPPTEIRSEPKLNGAGAYVTGFNTDARDLVISIHTMSNGYSIKNALESARKNFTYLTATRVRTENGVSTTKSLQGYIKTYSYDEVNKAYPISVTLYCPNPEEF